MRLPKLCHHKPTGRAFVKLEGKFRYLGKWDSPEARTAYRELCGELLREGLHETISHLTIDQLRVAYLQHCDAYYVDPQGRPTGEADNIRRALRFLDAWQDEPASQFGPRKLKVAREKMITAGLVRTSLNIHVKRTVRMFGWGVSEEMVPARVHQALTTVDGLRRGRSSAAEAPPVLPVPEEDYSAALTKMTPAVSALCRLIYLTGMRLSEARLIAWDDVDRTVNPWRYEPARHKTSHHGKQRVIFLGPKAQLLLKPYEADRGFVFRPNVMFNRGYSLHGLLASVRRACKRAEVENWSPGRLRHNFATRVRADYDIDAARVVLGHSEQSTTQIYAERDFRRAAEIAAAVG